jgi:cytochrome c-type biogenesis protein CcmH
MDICYLMPFLSRMRKIFFPLPGAAWVLLALWFGNPTHCFASQAQPMASDQRVEQRLVQIAEELRCLVCQNESLASSRADLAEDLRTQVREQIAAGKSDEEIKDYLVARYGDFVLYKPQLKPVTWLLWFGPFAVLIIALVGLILSMKARNAKIQAQGGVQTIAQSTEFSNNERLLAENAFVHNHHQPISTQQTDHIEGRQ